MQTLASGYKTTKQSVFTRLEALKAVKDEAASRLASDTTAVLGTSDVDQVFFLTPILKQYRMAQATAGNNTVGSLALLPTGQYSSLEDRYYKSGTAVTLDRAGSATTGFNIMRTGQTPDGYYGGDKVLVQKRTKLFPAGSDYPDIFVYAPPNVRAEPRGYVLQEDERYDGGFYPGDDNFGVERPYGTTFPVGDNGGYLYTETPFQDVGWSGETHEVQGNEDTKPFITSVEPDYYVLPGSDSSGEVTTITVNGGNFNGCGFVMIGPYLSNSPGMGIPGGGDFSGALPYRNVLSDSEIELTLSNGIAAGVYDVYVIGFDGQIGILQQSFTVYAAGDGP